MTSPSVASLTDQLFRLSRQLLPSPAGGSVLYPDDYTRLNHEIHTLIPVLCRHHPADADQEARLCLAVLMGFSVTMYANPEDERLKAQMLKRSFAVLDRISVSLLKCRLLVHCFLETNEERWGREAQLMLESLRMCNDADDEETREEIERILWMNEVEK